MKKLVLLVSVLFLPLALHADPWYAAISKNAGNYVETRSVTVTTYTATEVIDDAVAIKSSLIDVFVNNAFSLWIGSNTTTLSTTGFPVLSSKTYTTDGAFTGSLYGTADAAAAGNTNVRVIYWLKNDALR